MARYGLRLAAFAAAFLFQFYLPARASAQATFQLTINMSGTTSGRVGVVPGGNLCDVPGGGTNTCSYQIASGASVRVVANGTSVPGLFSGGTGPAAPCGLSTCSFTMTGTATINVNFNPANGTIVTMTTTLTGDGRGEIGVDNSRCQNFDPGQAAGCSTKYLQGSSVAIGPTAGPGSKFVTYSAGTGGAGICGSTPSCTFPITGNAAVTAQFAAITSLTVSPASALKAVGGPGQIFTAMGTYSDGVTQAIAPGMGAWMTVTPLPVARYSLGAVGHGGFVYAIGGIQSSAPAATVTRYDPSALTWTSRTPMSTPREGLGIAVIGSFIYAVGGNTTGSNPVATLEVYDPGANIWTTLAPMSAPRRFLAAAASNGKIYAIGGETVRLEAFNPATNTWTTKAAMPTALGVASAATAEGVLYVIGGSGTSLAARAYDPVQNSWALNNTMPTGRSELAMAALNGIIYAIGGLSGIPTPAPTTKVESFIEWLRWSSSQPGVAVIGQQGTATAVSPGSASIVASIGSLLCSPCATFTSFTSFPTDMALESPANNSTFTTGGTFDVTGWALNKGAPSGMGTGVDMIHVYAVPSSGPSIFLGVATYGLARSDIGAIYGSQFTNSGFTLTTGSSLAPGPYTIVSYARNALTGGFDAFKTANILLKAAVSDPFIDLNTPREGQVVTSSFEVGGWALDRGSPAGTGVDAVLFYVFPNNGASPGVFMGWGTYGLSRPDVAAFFGASRFTNSGFHFSISGLGPGAYLLGVYGRSTVTGGFTVIKQVHFTVNANQLLAVSPPSAEAAITAPVFDVDGWSIDKSIESTALLGTGVDTLHVYAYPNPGSGAPPIFLGVATYGISRPDVATFYGARYTNSGFHLAVDRSALGLTNGPYNIVVISHSTVSNTFNNNAVVRVTLQ